MSRIVDDFLPFPPPSSLSTHMVIDRYSLTTSTIIYRARSFLLFFLSVRLFMVSILRYNFVVLQFIALIFAIIAISTCSWEKVTLKDNDALQTIYHSPLLTALTAFDYFQIDYQNATGYLLQINTGLMDICTHLRRPNHLTYEPTRCKQTIARPAIGLAIIGVIFVVVGIVCTGFADEESQDDRAIELLSYGSAISTGLGGLLLFTSHWTYSLSSELQLPTLYVKYGYSTYLVVTSAVLSLLSMSLVLWRTYVLRAFTNQEPRVKYVRQRRSKRRGRNNRRS